MRVYFDPPCSRPISVRTQDGRKLSPVELADLANRRVKWAERVGSTVVAMLAASPGQTGTVLVFPDPSEYDKAVRRVFKTA